jgi:DNA-binding CsgD family transcriptional regulator
VQGDEGLVVEDLGSRNGVYVNQSRIKVPTVLAHGDVVGFGLKSFEVVDLEFAPRKRGPTLPMPFHESDVDGPPPVTVTPMLGILTEREREVFELIVLGYTQREIAEQLHLSVKTVETHRAHVAEKLRCRTRAELVAYAITAGVLAKPGR